ncbi:MAG: transcription antitermination factor NusB [Verrucomicrobiota bacterium]
MGDLPRKVSLRLLRDWETSSQYIADLLESYRQSDTSRSDRSSVQRLTYSVVRNQNLLHYWIGKYTRKRPDPTIRRILSQGFAELMLLDTPPHAAIGETVNLAPKHARSLVNAVLRNADRDRASLEKELPHLPPEVRWSIPRFLWDRWVEQFGEPEASSLCQWNHQPAVNYLRLNRLRPLPGVSFEKANLTPREGWRGFFHAPSDWPAEWIAQGHAYFQDPSTSCAIEALALKPGLCILDACAAPGGKTFAIAEALENQGDIWAADRSPNRLERMRDNLSRLGVKAHLFQHDWTEPPPEHLPRQFDRVLLDAPCSNSGVIRRRIDVPHRLTPQDYVQVTQLQKGLLHALAPLVAPQGRLVYSICSMDREESGALIQSFLKEHPEFSEGTSRLTLPWKDGVDGSFAVALHRTG